MISRKHIPFAAAALSALAGLVIVAVPSSAYAQEGVPASAAWPRASGEPTTRAAVLAELRRWRATGVDYEEPAADSTLSRPTVRAQAMAARASGEIAAMTGEPHAFTLDLPSAARTSQPRLAAGPAPL